MSPCKKESRWPAGGFFLVNTSYLNQNDLSSYSENIRGQDSEYFSDSKLFISTSVCSLLLSI